MSIIPSCHLIKGACLIAPESPRQAFYSIWIEKYHGGFRVCKESGTRCCVLDRRVWPFDSYDEAQRLFDRRVREKTNPGRRSPRKYRFKGATDGHSTL
jgi:hypothetical protein